MEYKSGVNVTGTRLEKSQLNSLWILKSIAQPKAVFVLLYQAKGTKQFSGRMYTEFSW